MKTKLFTLHTRDILKGLILAIITAVVTLLVNELQAGSTFDIALLKKIGMAALIAFLSYLLKNFLTNSKDEFITPEK
jgi:hypothetical protein